MSKYDEFDLDIQLLKEENFAISAATEGQICVISFQICATGITYCACTVSCGCATNTCSGNTCSACRSYCGSGCR